MRRKRGQLDWEARGISYLWPGELSSFRVEFLSENIGWPCDNQGRMRCCEGGRAIAGAGAGALIKDHRLADWHTLHELSALHRQLAE